MPQYGNFGLGPLYIDLDIPVHTRKHYAPGDVVTGRVRVESKSKPLHIKINFVGRCKVCITQGSSDMETIFPIKTVFFSRTIDLFSDQDSSYKEMIWTNTDRYVYFPFGLCFPREVEREAPMSEGQPFKPDAQFERLPGHQLPPSFSGVHSREREQKIEYMVEAIMNMQKSTLFIRKEEKVRQRLLFRPIGASPPESPPQLCRPIVLRRQTRLLDPSAPIIKGLMHRMKYRVSHDKAEEPSVTFSLAASIPLVVRAGQPVPILLFLQHLDRSDSIPAPPLPSEVYVSACLLATISVSPSNSTQRKKFVIA
jgi:hypothetical protein